MPKPHNGGGLHAGCILLEYVFRCDEFDLGNYQTGSAR